MDDERRCSDNKTSGMFKTSDDISSERMASLAAAAATAAQHNRFSSRDEFTSGYLAACTSIFLLFPLNKLIFRQILDGVSFRKAFDQLRSEGFQHAYRGMLPPLLQKSTSYSVMFGSQHEYYMRLMNSQIGRSSMNFNTRKHVKF